MHFILKPLYTSYTTLIICYICFDLIRGNPFYIRDFNREKEQLISDLKLAIAEHPEEKILVEILRILLDLNVPKQLVNIPGAIDNAGLADFQIAISANPKSKSPEAILKLLSKYGQKRYPGVLSRMIVDMLDYQFQIGGAYS